MSQIPQKNNKLGQTLANIKKIQNLAVSLTHTTGYDISSYYHGDVNMMDVHVFLNGKMMKEFNLVWGNELVEDLGVSYSQEIVEYLEGLS